MRTELADVLRKVDLMRERALQTWRLGARPWIDDSQTTSREDGVRHGRLLGGLSLNGLKDKAGVFAPNQVTASA